MSGIDGSEIGGDESDGGDDAGLALVVIGVMLLIGPLLAGALAAIHPLLWVGIAFAMIAVGLSTSDTATTTTAAEEPPRTNCEHCGARVPADRPDCDYCGDPLTTPTGE